MQETLYPLKLVYRKKLSKLVKFGSPAIVELFYYYFRTSEKKDF